MSNFRIKHIGIRTDSAEEARETASLLAALFDLSGTREMPSAVWAGRPDPPRHTHTLTRRGHHEYRKQLRAPDNHLWEPRAPLAPIS